MTSIETFESCLKEIKNSKHQHKYYFLDMPRSDKDEFINHLFDFAGGTEITFPNNDVLPSGIDCVLNYCGLTLFIKWQ